MSYNLPHLFWCLINKVYYYYYREGGACLSSTARKNSQNWFAFSTDENSETLESSAINDGRSMLAMFLTVLHKVEGLETEILK